MNKSKFIAFLKLRTLLLKNCTEEAIVEKGPTAVIEIDTNSVFGSDRFEFFLPRPVALAGPPFKKQKCPTLMAEQNH